MSLSEVPGWELPSTLRYSLVQGYNHSQGQPGSRRLIEGLEAQVLPSPAPGFPTDTTDSVVVALWSPHSSLQVYLLSLVSKSHKGSVCLITCVPRVGEPQMEIGKLSSCLGLFNNQAITCLWSSGFF